MSPEILQILAVTAIVLSLIAVATALIAWRVQRRSAAGPVRKKLDNEIAALRAEIESTRDRHRMLEDRFERYERTQAETRESLDRMREDVEARLTRLQSHDAGQKALQEQIYEIRKEHQVLMERDDRHDRREAEIQEQITSLQADLSTARTDGSKSHSRT